MRDRTSADSVWAKPGAAARLGLCVAGVAALGVLAAQGRAPAHARPGGGEQKILRAAEVLGPLRAGAPTVEVIVGLRLDEAAPVDWRSERSRAGRRARVAAAQDAALFGLRAGEVVVGHRFQNIPGFSATVTAQGLAALQAHPGVVVIEPVIRIEPQLAQGVPQIGAAAFRGVYDGTGVAIAVCDTGIDYTHPALGGGGFPNAKVIGGYDFGDNDADPFPNSPDPGRGHGTGVAGIAAGDLGQVGDYIGGVAPGATLYDMKTSTAADSGTNSAILTACWDWCITNQHNDPDNPILVINASLGGGRFTGACDGVSWASTQAAAAAEAAGITLVVSSGNDGFCDALAYPSCISHAISVGAVYDADIGPRTWCVSAESCIDDEVHWCPSGKGRTEDSETDQVTAYSNSAPILDILAPSFDAHTLDMVGPAGFHSGDYFPSFGGTSAAAPYVAGAVAALQSAALHLTGGYLTPQQVRQALVSTGPVLTDPKSGQQTARVDVEAAIRSIARAGDLNTDGVVDGADLGLFLLGWGACPGGGEPCAADLNGDGVVDGTDLGVLLLNWG